MKKVFFSLVVAASMVTSSAVVAQEAEEKLDAQAAETVEAVVDASSPAEEVAPVAVAVDAQESVSDGVALDQPGVPMAPAVGSEVMVDAGVISGGGFVDAGYGQAFVPSSCCNSCCGDASFVQPVVFNQPVFQDTTAQAVPAIQASTTSIVTAAPAPAAVYSQSATPGCGSCSGGGIVNYAPSYSAAPAASYPTAAPVDFSYAPVETSYVEAAPAVSSGCGSCGSAAVSCAAPTCCPQNSRLRRGMSTRIGGALLGRLIRDR